ncbi:hypothetical protein EJ04DRAFT_22744 [Polyplosphaeria fusca]|uniref:Uncharacterized protein n=1 Tax=Polyplosphaeria fusca TaxID=682080 RepID=A0A9P4R3K2_9PLEO|nr:hypothetical protein EJ04DRAFT_22744 [Polyplosphaeria fusca]
MGLPCLDIYLLTDLYIACACGVGTPDWMDGWMDGRFQQVRSTVLFTAAEDRSAAQRSTVQCSCREGGVFAPAASKLSQNATHARSGNHSRQHSCNSTNGIPSSPLALFLWHPDCMSCRAHDDPMPNPIIAMTEKGCGVCMLEQRKVPLLYTASCARGSEPGLRAGGWAALSGGPERRGTRAVRVRYLSSFYLHAARSWAGLLSAAVAASCE